MDSTSQGGSQEVDEKEFETFVKIIKEALSIALKFPKPSINVRWLQDYSESFQKSDFTSDNLNYFFRYFPDINSVTAITLNDDSIDLIHDQIGTIINDWKFQSRRIKGILKYLFDDQLLIPSFLYLLELLENFKNRDLLPIRFNYSYGEGRPLARAALAKYVRTGELMRADEDAFKNSNIFRFEDILMNRRPAIESYLGSSCFADSVDHFESGFIAIVAPSLEGKTQSAFAFRNVKPLYFVLSLKASVDDDPSSQRIYLNYATLSRKLLDLSKEDIAKLESDSLSDNRFLVRISATNLQSEHYRKIKFRVLGFLAALIEHARNNEPALTTMSWMEFYATAPRNFDFLPMSVEDLETFDFTGFCVFLDEFDGSRASVFIRNVCRASGIMVVVSNTNTNIANLVGRTSSRHSRGPELCAWCLVINHLNTLNEAILKSMVPELESSMQSLKSKIKRSDLHVLESFFNDFLSTQLNHLRPGFAHAIAEFIVSCDVAIHGEFSFLDFLKTVVLKLGIFLLTRKPNVLKQYEGMLGTKALYMSNAYHSNINEEMPMLLHRKSYLNYHYFYLINPVKTTQWCFLTFPPVPSDDNENTEAQSSLRVMNTSNQPDGWNKELTFFKAGEFIAYLSFLSIWHKQSIDSVFTHGSERHQASPYGTVEMSNPTQPVPFSGSSLEVLSTVCLIDASHRSIDSIVMTFTGQSGRTFFSNLVKNLIVADENRVKSTITVSFHDGCEIGDLMDLIHVPFLFPANLPIPVFFRQFMSVEGFNQREIHVGGFERTHTNDEIDAKFQFFLKSEKTAENPSLEICTVECKHWRRTLSLENLVGIFQKAQAQNAKLSLVFCNQVCDYQKETKDPFVDICLKKRWNVLRLFKSLTGGFEFDKFEAEIDSETGRYSMYCIVVELETVNNPLKLRKRREMEMEIDG